MTKRIYDLANAALLLLMGVFIASWYPRLPDRVPAHFGLSGRPDRWSGRGAFIALFLVPLAMTGLIYLLIRFIPRLGANPRHLNIPHKEEFLKLPAERQEPYWALLKEFFAGLMAVVNLLFYLILRGITHVAMGEAALLTTSAILPALALMAALLLLYLWRLFVLPGKLIRGEG